MTYHTGMSGQLIGIKLADRSFFPIVSEDEPGRRRVLLSAAQDHQNRVDIVLYRAVSAPSGTHQRIGDLSLFNLPDRAAGDSEFELIVGVDGMGHMDARVTDLTSGDSRDLAADLDDLPFDLDEPEFDQAPGAVEPRRREPRRRALWLIPAAILLLALIALAVWFFVLRDRGDQTAERPADAVTEVVPQESPNEVAPETIQPAETEPEAVSPDAVEPEETAPEVVEPGVDEIEMDESTVSETPSGGTTVEVPYEIIRGDTLWDISIHFYGTPWKFREIAERNAIVNPDLIYADDDIVIPADP